MAFLFFSSNAFFDASLHNNHFGFPPAAVALELLPVTPVEVGLLAKIAVVSFSIAMLFVLMKASICLLCFLVNSATNSLVALAISSMMFAEPCPVARAVVESCQFNLENLAHLSTLSCA